MFKMFKSKVVVLLVASGIVIALGVGLLSYTSHLYLALAVGAFFNALIVAVAYWRIREVLAIISRKSNAVSQSIESLTNYSQSSFRTMQMNLKSTESRLKSLETSSKQLSQLSPNSSASLGYNSEKISELHDQFALLRDQLNGNQAILQEILISLDLRRV